MWRDNFIYIGNQLHILIKILKIIIIKILTRKRVSNDFRGAPTKLPSLFFCLTFFIKWGSQCPTVDWSKKQVVTLGPGSASGASMHTRVEVALLNPKHSRFDPTVRHTKRNKLSSFFDKPSSLYIPNLSLLSNSGDEHSSVFMWGNQKMPCLSEKGRRPHLLVRCKDMKEGKLQRPSKDPFHLKASCFRFPHAHSIQHETEWVYWKIFWKHSWECFNISSSFSNSTMVHRSWDSKRSKRNSRFSLKTLFFRSIIRLLNSIVLPINFTLVIFRSEVNRIGWIEYFSPLSKAKRNDGSSSSLADQLL